MPGLEIKKLNQGSKVNEGTRVVRVMDGCVGDAQYAVHNPSLVNVCRGIAERVLYTRKDGVLSAPCRPEKGVFRLLDHVRSLVIANTRSTSPVALEDYPSLYSDARKRVRYEEAVLSLSTQAISKRDAIVNTFVKAEKVNISEKGDPAPRVIQPRSYRYNACLGRFLKVLEKNIVLGFARAFGYNVIAKGLNAQETGSLLRENWEAFGDPVAVGLDASRFDQHVSVDALRFEHGFYHRLFNNDPELKRLLSWQLCNTGVAYVDGHKIKYNTEGRRCSGDINTGMGNCIIMSNIVLGYFASVGVKARLTNNGDDCVVICERRDVHLLDGIDDWFRRFGFKLTREPTVDVFEHIVFCQTQPVQCSDGWRMVRNPFTATSKDMTSLLPWDNQTAFSHWASAIGKCGSALTAGVPFWESFYRRFVGLDSEGAEARIRDSGLGYMAKGMHSKAVIDDTARYSFWLAFGILPDDQEALEGIDISIGYSEPVPLMYGNISKFSELLTPNGKI